MYIMYVDESGDIGLNNSPTKFFVLSGIVVHESRWRDLINTLIVFKKNQRIINNLPIRVEIHASEFISKNTHNIELFKRLAILRNTLDELAKLDYISVTNIIVDKTNKPVGYDVFNNAWMALFQRFENTLQYGNFPGGYSNDHGIVITDATAGETLAKLVRKMAVHNYIPNQNSNGARNIPITRIIEDPYGKNSEQTLPIQAADVIAYFLHQKYSPNSYIKRKGAKNYFNRLNLILNKRASSTNSWGVVEL